MQSKRGKYLTWESAGGTGGALPSSRWEAKQSSSAAGAVLFFTSDKIGALRSYVAYPGTLTESVPVD